MATGTVSRRRRWVKPPDRLHVAVAKKVTALGLTPLLDVGCNDCALGRCLPSWTQWCGIDTDPSRSARARRRSVYATAVCLPFRDNTFGAVALLYMLGFVPMPEAALAEAYRVLRPGGVVALGGACMDDPPEVRAWVKRPSSSCDALAYPTLVGQLFTDVEVLTRSTHAEAGSWWVNTAGETPRTVPFPTTRREVLVFGRKP